VPEETTITQQQDSNDGHDMNKGTNAQGYEPKGVQIYRIAEKKQKPKEGHTRK
jgi:hypothetical protein